MTRRPIIVPKGLGSTTRGTSATLESKLLFPNYSLRNVIRSFIEALAAPPPTLMPHLLSNLWRMAPERKGCRFSGQQ